MLKIINFNGVKQGMTELLFTESLHSGLSMGEVLFFLNNELNNQKSVKLSYTNVNVKGDIFLK